MYVIYYIQRWMETNIQNLLKNIITACLIFELVCLALPDTVFTELQFGPTKTCIFSLLMCAIWAGFFNSIALFYSESSYMLDDLQKFLPTSSYMIANVLIQFFLCLTEAVTCTLVFYLNYKFSLKGVVFGGSVLIDYVITFFLLMMCSDMMGMVLGMFVNKITTAMTMIPMVLIVQMLFSGCLFDLGGMISSLSTFTVAKWGYAALGSIADLNSYIDERIMLPVDLFEVSAGYIEKCWLYLLLLTILFIVMSWIIVFMRTNSQSD